MSLLNFEMTTKSQLQKMRDRERWTQEQRLRDMYEQGRFYGNPWGTVEWQVTEEPAPPPPEPEWTRSEANTRAMFEKLMGVADAKRTLSLTDKMKHELHLGTPEEYAEEKKPEQPKRICGICHDPRCPYSD